MWYDDMRAEARRQNIALSDLSWESECSVTQIFASLHMSTNDYERATSTDPGLMNKF